MVLTLSMLLPITLGSPAGAEQLGDRYIDMSASQTNNGSGRDGGDAFGQNVTYTVNFEVTSTTDVQGIVVEFCDDSPIVGDSCDTTVGNVPDISGAAVAASSASVAPDNDPNAWTDAYTGSKVTLTNGTGFTGLSAGDSIGFDITGIDNPTSTGTFYARIVTFATGAAATSYTSASPGTYIDEGGIALAVANELTVTARVQEVLEFCVGTETASSITPATGDDCATNVAGTDLDLGVVDSNSIATTSTIDTPNDGIMMIRTNALNGATVYYKAELDTSSGQLKQAGATCSGTDLDDPCFNSIGSGNGTRAAISSGTEAFGVALKERITTTGGATNDLVCDAAYAGDANTTLGTSCVGAVAGNNYAWMQDGTFDTLASSSGPLDDELVALEFAATASPTTPTGLYSVTSNFVATATY